jgi:hypothetical protein
MYQTAPLPPPIPPLEFQLRRWGKNILEHSVVICSIRRLWLRFTYVRLKCLTAVIMNIVEYSTKRQQAGCCRFRDLSSKALFRTVTCIRYKLQALQEWVLFTQSRPIKVFRLLLAKNSSNQLSGLMLWRIRLYREMRLYREIRFTVRW